MYQKKGDIGETEHQVAGCKQDRKRKRRLRMEEGGRRLVFKAREGGNVSCRAREEKGNRELKNEREEEFSFNWQLEVLGLAK